MKIYSEEEAARMLPRILDQVLEEGGLRIRRADGSLIDLRPCAVSPLDVPAPATDVTRDEIVAWIRSNRRRA